MIRRMILASAVLLTVAACSSASEPVTVDISPAATATATATGIPSLSPSDVTFSVPPTSPTKTYEGDGFTIEHPGGWAVEEALGGNCQATTAVVCFFAPAQDGQVPAAIMVSVFAGTTPTKLQTVWNTQRQLIINSLGSQPKTVPGSTGDTTMADLPAKTATYTLNWGLIPATARQTMVLADDDMTAYTVTEISATDIWEGLSKAFDDTEASFTLD